MVFDKTFTAITHPSPPTNHFTTLLFRSKRHVGRVRRSQVATVQNQNIIFITIQYWQLRPRGE